MDWLEVNRAYWDERVPLHAVSRFHDVAGFIGGAETLGAYEPEQVGDVTGRTLLHLMCHMGLDTLSWARRGARVTGLDFSQPALDIAADLANAAGIESARFVNADIDHAVEALGGETFDVVYTGRGVLQWIPDLDRWASVIAALLSPDGVFYITDFYITDRHPSDDVLDDEEPVVTWTHDLDSVVKALTRAGLRIEFLHEYESTPPMFSLRATKSS